MEKTKFEKTIEVIKAIGNEKLFGEHMSFLDYYKLVEMACKEYGREEVYKALDMELFEVKGARK